MGFFSWKTSDSGRSIPSIHSGRPTFPVLMIDDKGNQFMESEYEGYGVFGGKDFYVLVDEMNGGTGERERGIDLLFKDNPTGSGAIAKEKGVKIPVLVEPSQIQHLLDVGKNVWSLSSPPEPCPDQGYFYDDYDD